MNTNRNLYLYSWKAYQTRARLLFFRREGIPAKGEVCRSDDDGLTMVLAASDVASAAGNSTE
jgi:hypothetical protein